MTRIGVSGLFVRPGRVGGAESMLFNLLSGLSAVKSPADALYLFHDNASGGASPVRGVSYRKIVTPGFSNRFTQEALVLPWYCRGVDSLLFPNYFTPPISPATRTVTVIHDLQYRHFPQYFSRKKRAWLRAAHEATLRQADSVIVLSQFVYDDILQQYGSRFENRLKVIPNPVSWSRFGSEASPAPLNSPYILSVSAHYPHKNLETLIRAFASIRAEIADFRLVLVGQVPGQLVGTSDHRDLGALIDELELTDAVRVTGFISDSELGAWYRHASLFVFPSLFEGFGMPPVEALGLRVPVLTTTRGSLHEATMGYAEYMEDPLDHREMAARMREMILNPQGFRVSPSTTNAVRKKYEVSTIAGQYYRELCG